MNAHKPRLGLVSLDAPLISNLAVWSNIGLIRQYHENLPAQDAKRLALDLLGRLHVASIAEKRNPSLTSEERFFAMLLRAAMVRNAIVVLDRPFRILTDHRDGRLILDCLRKLDDLIAETYIFDYTWVKVRYGGADGTEE
ncbi:MAG: hypothetical protein AB1558_04230 [Thermodesulfobacteriota bacterium]